MSEQEQANFTEVLELRLDVPGFKASLDEAKETWLSWVESLGADGST
jgi:hypothetical protein